MINKIVAASGAAALVLATVLLLTSSGSQPQDGQSNALALAGSEQKTEELKFYSTHFLENVWVYNGPEEHNRHLVPFICKLIKRHHFRTTVEQFMSLSDAPLRSALWAKQFHSVVFPPFESYPRISENGKTDLRAYVAAGNNVVFMGSYLSLQTMNDVFGFSLRDDFKEGPYYRNDRNVRGTPFQYLGSRLSEPTERVYGAMTKSLPPGGRSIYDSLGASVVFYVRYDLGTVTYVGYQYDSPFHIDDWVRVLHAAIAI